MTRQCGREQMCEPCDQLPLSADQSAVCFSVGIVSRENTTWSMSESALNIALREEFHFCVDDDDYVTRAMSVSALSSIIGLEK